MTTTERETVRRNRTASEERAMIFWAIVVVGVVLTIAHAIEIYLQLWG